MSVISIDPGFGETKIAIKDDNNRISYHKEVNLIAKLNKSENSNLLKDNDLNVVEYGSEKYYIGSNASQFPQANLINITNYDSLLKIIPIILKYILAKYGTFDKYVIDLSIAHIDHASDFKRFIIENLKLKEESVFVVPQGIGCKLAVDQVGLDLNVKSDSNVKNYLGIDIGFLTIDIIRVVSGKLNSNDIIGYEGEGVIKITDSIVNYLRSNHSIEISVPIAKKILADGYYRSRGASIDMSSVISEFKKEYIKKLINFLETNYASSIDQIDNIIIFGGGAEIIKEHLSYWNESYSNNFVLIPVTGSEYYNAIGNLFVVNLVK